MKNLREFLQTGPLCADGAAGTYLYSTAGRRSVPCESFNISEPETVIHMHRRYIEAGARFILANTFASSYAAIVTGNNVSTIIRAGVSIARQAADGSAYVCADIGQLPDDISSIDAYIEEADAFIGEEIDIYMFETFSDSALITRVADHIRSRIPDAFIIASFAVSPDGFSRSGRSGQSLISDVIKSNVFDGAGFNCCSGPAHLLSYASKIDFGTLIPVIRPNAGYPGRNIHNAQSNGHFPGSPEYFADTLSPAANRKFKIIGGCCGTDPEHIRLLSSRLDNPDNVRIALIRPDTIEAASPERKPDTFAEAIKERSSPVYVAEIEPPFNSDLAKFDEASRILAASGFNAITVADSPMSKVRADSLLCATRITRITGVHTIPHLCCRDRNVNAIRSSLVAAHAEGIRTVLAITGDPVPESDRSSVKSVFNLSSVKLCRFIRNLNDELFPNDPIMYGCAFNANAINMDAEFTHLERKIGEGASFILTQPVFSEKAVDAVIRTREYGIRTLAGIYIPVSYRNTVFLANEMPGFDIPDRIIRNFTPDMTREEGEQMGLDIAFELAKSLASNTEGYYFMTPFNRVYLAAFLLSRLKITSAESHKYNDEKL